MGDLTHFEFSSRGGKARARSLSKRRRRQIASIAGRAASRARKRRKKQKRVRKLTHEKTQSHHEA